MGTTVIVAVVPEFWNQPPVITYVKVQYNSFPVVSEVPLDVFAYDPDGDPITYLWRVVATTTSCDISSANTDQAAIVCWFPGAAMINIAVTDSHGASTDRSFFLNVLPESG